MYKLVLLALASISLIGCGSESSLEDKPSSNAETPGLGSAIGTDSGSLSDSVPTSYVNLKAAVRLETSVDYTWSVRARTDVGYGEWSAGLEFSIHPSEDLALADAIAKDDSVEDYNAGLYSDALPVPTVISSSPVGSLVNAQPTFKWDPVSDAISYEVRVMQVDSDIQVFTDTYTALDVCQSNACELPSTAEEATQTPIAVTDNNGTPTTNVDPDSPEPEMTPAVEVTTPPVVEVVPEVEVNTPVAEVEPEVEAETPVVEVEPEVEAETPVVEVEPEVEAETPVVEVEPEVEAETPVVEVEPEVEVEIPVVEVEPEVEAETPVVEVEPEVEVEIPVVEVIPEVEIETPVVEILPEEEVETPDPEEENNVPDTNPLPVANAAENPEIEALQQSEGVLAFPGALGYAKNALGGRGGRVVVVNTVSNTVNASDNLMSLREATTVETGPRTIVFSVGGVFDAGDAELIMSGEADSNVTVACQSAPAPGVTIKTYGFALQNGAHDIIFRHCAVRLISVNSTRARAGRTVTVRGGSRNIMLDHMSFAWATDENFQAYLAPGEAVGIENVTVSNSAVVEGDADSAHPESVEHHSWFYHAMGPSCNNNNPSSRITGCSIVNNFIAHNSTRNAMIWGGDGELKNNIIYNWYGIGLTVQPHDGGDVSAIIDNNLMKSGPDTKGGTSNPNCGPAQYRCAMYLGKTNFRGTSRFLVGNNYYIPEYKTFDDVVLIDHQNANTPAGTPLFDSATDSPIPVLDMAARGSRFMACVGASRPERDHIDTRVIEEFYNGTGSIGIGENNRAGGHNQNIQRTWHLFGPNTTHPAGYDTDNDGMPNEWEIAYGLDPNNANDHAGDIDSDGYTNLEEYLAIAAHC